uniref:Uncharacterized protein n=1 Tax=Anopheles maculatus TaxID=74869 RepID=A0A182TCQ6_9DIPT
MFQQPPGWMMMMTTTIPSTRLYIHYSHTLPKVVVFGARESRALEALGSQHDQGPVCGGICCDAETERQLQAKATKNFERLVKHHIRSQRGHWETAANLYKGRCTLRI